MDNRQKVHISPHCGQVLERAVVVLHSDFRRSGQNPAKSVPGSPCGFAECGENRFADCKDPTRIHRLKMYPCLIKARGQYSDMVPVFYTKLYAGFRCPECLAPFAQKQQTPWQNELTYPIGETQIRIVFVLSQQNRQTLDGALLSFSVFGRAPIHEVTVERVPRRQKGVTTTTNFLEGIFTILHILGVPSTYPHPAYQTTRARPRSHQWIRLSGAQLKRPLDHLQRPPRIGPRQRTRHAHQRAYFHIQ